MIIAGLRRQGQADTAGLAGAEVNPVVGHRPFRVRGGRLGRAVVDIIFGERAAGNLHQRRDPAGIV